MKLFSDRLDSGFPSVSQEMAPDMQETSQEEKFLGEVVSLRTEIERLCNKFSASNGDQEQFFQRDTEALSLMLNAVTQSPFFTVQFFDGYAQKHPVIGKFVVHDLVSISSAVFAEIGILKDLNLQDSMDQDCFYDMCREHVLSNMSRYVRTLEDNLLRSLEDVDVPLQAFDYRLLGDELSAIEYGRSMKASGRPLSPDIQVHDRAKDVIDERKAFGRAGVVDNFVINCVNNALRELVGATHIEVSFFVDEATQELVYQVRDDGVGIPNQMFDPSRINEIRLFETGVSESKSTGIGMSDANIRLPQYGVKLAISSIRDGQRNMWRSNNFGEAESQFPEDLSKGTLIEIRVALVS